MLIRSQDKKSLFNMDAMTNLQINKEFGDSRATYRVAIYFTEDDMATMGEYSTEAKAIKVLDAIQDFYNKCFAFSMENDGYYHDVSENKVFEMPSDEEVEV